LSSWHRHISNHQKTPFENKCIKKQTEITQKCNKQKISNNQNVKTEALKTNEIKMQNKVTQLIKKNQLVEALL